MDTIVSWSVIFSGYFFLLGVIEEVIDKLFPKD
jgi:hypothetical protein